MNSVNNAYDRDPSDLGLDSRQTNNNQAKQNVLGIIQLQEQRRKSRKEAIRALHISPKDQF